MLQSLLVPGLLLLAQASGPANDAPATTQASDLVDARIGHRILKTFDFDERDFNYEPIPQNWNAIWKTGFPRFLEPRFDENVGHTAPPSFYLGLQTGSIGAHYLAKDIDVHPNSDYEIAAWIRTEGLEHAEAGIEAYYLNHALRQVRGSRRRSVGVRSDPKNNGWQQIRVHLPGGMPSARWIGLAVYVRQQSPLHKIDAAQPGRLAYQEVHGGAWFDDIRIVRMPQITLRTAAPGNVFAHDDPVEIITRIADLDGAELDTGLDIFNADGLPVDQRSVPVVDFDAPPTPIRITDLQAGLYEARLTVTAPNIEPWQRTVRFLRLNPAVHAGAVGRGENTGGDFGIILAEPHGIARKTIGRLAQLLGADALKVPLWQRDTSDEAIVRGDPHLDRLLEDLVRAGRSVVATLDAPPASLEARDEERTGVFDVLASDPDTWRPYLALIAARYGSWVKTWQIGSDIAPIDPADERVAKAAEQVRAELFDLVSGLTLQVPRAYRHTLPADRPRVASAIIIPAGVPTDALHAYLASNDPDQRPDSITLLLSDDERYARRPRLVDLARRLVLARHSIGTTVFIHAPWRVETLEGVDSVAPREAFILFRTLSQALAGLASDGAVRLDPHTRGVFFADRSSGLGALVAWRDGDADSLATVSVECAAGARRIDLWGNVTPLTETDGPVDVQIDAMPVVISPVHRWTAKLLESFAVDDPQLEAVAAEQPRTVRLTNPRTSQLRAELSFDPPPGWRIRPRRIAVDLKPGETLRAPIAIRVPINQAVGEYTLDARLGALGADILRLQTAVEIISNGLDVKVLSRLDGANVRVIQRMTNTSDKSLDLRSYVLAPGHGPMSRMVHGLAPGETAIREYVMENIAALAGNHVRVSVEEVNGPLRRHDLLKF